MFRPQWIIISRLAALLLFLGAALGAAGAGAPVEQTADITLPLAAVIATVVAILLALATWLIVARRRTRAMLGWMLGILRKLGAPAARRRRLVARRAVGQRFAADLDSLRRAYGTLGDFAPDGGRPERPVHAVRVDPAGTTVWLHAADEAGAPWTRLDKTRWRRSANAGPWNPPGPGPTPACLVRAGADADGEPVFIDLSRLDGVLSVAGDTTVARDVVRNLLAEVARCCPGTPVTVLRDGAVARQLAIPPGLRPVGNVGGGWAGPAHQGSAQQGSARQVGGAVRGAAHRHPVTGLVVLAGEPSDREAADLAALCGPGGAGWTGLVCGAAGTAHWSWTARADGTVEIPVLDLALTAPA